jgi:hypothetical protein
MSATPAADRRPGRARRRVVSPDAVLAVLLPVACAAALVLVRPEADRKGAHPPASTELATASVVCPAAMSDRSREGADGLGVTTLAGEPGEDTRGPVGIGLGEDVRRVAVRTGQVTAVRPGRGPVVVTGSGELAPGLVAGRSGSAPLAAADCGPTAADQWFTGVGAGATHSSVLELVNPNVGRAVADITVWSQNGPLDVERLRGVTVPGGSSTRLELGELVPRRRELTVEVTTLRGQLGTVVEDTYDELGGGLRATDWLPGQAAPSLESVLLGLARGQGARTLVLGNPGASELRAEIKIVTPRSVFSPSGVEPVRVAPGTSQKLTLSSLLEDATDKGAIGLVVSANGPVTTTLRQVVDGDVSLLAPAEPVSSSTAVVVPPGRKRLVLADPAAVGAATVTALAADGEQLSSERLELKPGTGANIELPDEAALVVLTPERTSVRAAVLVVGDGNAVVRMRELVRTGLVPDVRPALP